MPAFLRLVMSEMHMWGLQLLMLILFVDVLMLLEKCLMRFFTRTWFLRLWMLLKNEFLTMLISLGLSC